MLNAESLPCQVLRSCPGLSLSPSDGSFGEDGEGHTQCLSLLPFPEAHSSASVAQISPLPHPVGPCPGTLEHNDWQDLKRTEEEMTLVGHSASGGT